MYLSSRARKVNRGKTTLVAGTDGPARRGRWSARDGGGDFHEGSGPAQSCPCLSGIIQPFQLNIHVRQQFSWDTSNSVHGLGSRRPLSKPPMTSDGFKKKNCKSLGWCDRYFRAWCIRGPDTARGRDGKVAGFGSPAGALGKQCKDRYLFLQAFPLVDKLSQPDVWGNEKGTGLGVSAAAPSGGRATGRASVRVSGSDDEGIMHVPQRMRPHTGWGRGRPAAQHMLVSSGAGRPHARGPVFDPGLACRGARAEPHCNTKSHRLHGLRSPARCTHTECPARGPSPALRGRTPGAARAQAPQGRRSDYTFVSQSGPCSPTMGCRKTA